MGGGYKSFCENVGGTYLDGKTLKFNPFANISNIKESGERIRDQLAVLASPDGSLDEVHLSLLLRGVQEAWEESHEKARIDHVVQKLTAIREDDKYQNSPGITNRLDEIVELLGKYCSWGIYGEYFNSDEPSLTDDARFIVLELGGLQDKPDLLVAVMFSLIIYIEDKMYRTPRDLKKCCTIDEGWKLLNFKNEKVGQFIETGYRTVRRHRGAFITISQNIKDFDADDASGAAKAAWGNSAFKVILKQDASEFKQYISQVAQRYGLFFFYRGNNAVDNLMAGVIRTFCEDRGISLMAVSVDGKLSDQLPQSRPDSGQAEKMRVTHFPATFLVDPKTHQWQPLAWGFMSHDDLDRQMVSVLTHFAPDY